jgi:osmoprotectant transport system permease protein
MDLLQGAFQYYLQNQAFFWQAFRHHLALSLSALGISIAVSLPLGVWIARRAGLAQVVMNVFNAFRVIPSLAITTNYLLRFLERRAEIAIRGESK